MVLDDTTAFPVAFLGAMRIGAVPVPVSPLDRDDNFRHYVDDSYADVVVTDAAVTAAAAQACSAGRTSATSSAASPRTRRPISTAGTRIARATSSTPAPTHRDDMAFWLYSSGSTGKPKGVVHLHHDIEFTCETFADGCSACARTTSTSRRPSSSTPTGSATASRSRSGSAPRRC